jgi:hypothetical protein
VDVTGKLQIKTGLRVCVAAAGEVPAAVTELAAQGCAPGDADAVVAFAVDSAELGTVAGPAVTAAQ